MSLDQWNARFSSEAYVFGEAPNAFLSRQKPRLPAAGRALAVADGEGRNGVWLAQQGLSVHSIDGSSARGVEFELELADLSDWSWPQAAYDVVAAIFIQFAGPDLRAALFDGMKRSLKPGGLLLMEGYRPEQLDYGTGGPRVVENLYTEALLAEAFSDFEIAELAVYDGEIQEGPGHAGMSALIDLVARKPA
ncbi:MAG TPA: class I SAM-dependent methyltransferase [Phenylobacterium sp.]|nr:class I SAM-dependent methyltransferase [Phenylobacterium sp.]